MTKRNYAAFDLETAGEIPEGSDWQEHRPLGITCAALYAPELGEPVTWYGAAPDGEIADTMNREELALMVRQLETLQSHRGFTIVTWNGAGIRLQRAGRGIGNERGVPRTGAGTRGHDVPRSLQAGPCPGAGDGSPGHEGAGEDRGDGRREGGPYVARGAEGRGDRLLRPGHPLHAGGCHGLRGGEKPPVDQRGPAATGPWRCAPDGSPSGRRSSCPSRTPAG